MALHNLISSARRTWRRENLFRANETSAVRPQRCSVEERSGRVSEKERFLGINGGSFVSMGIGGDSRYGNLFFYRFHEFIWRNYLKTGTNYKNVKEISCSK